VCVNLLVFVYESNTMDTYTSIHVYNEGSILHLHLCVSIGACARACV